MIDAKQINNIQKIIIVAGLINLGCGGREEMLIKINLK
jgi:hypothetical protein